MNYGDLRGEGLFVVINGGADATSAIFISVGAAIHRARVDAPTRASVAPLRAASCVAAGRIDSSLTVAPA